MLHNSATKRHSHSPPTGLRSVFRRLPKGGRKYVSALLAELCEIAEVPNLGAQGDVASAPGAVREPLDDCSQRPDPELMQGLASVATAVWRMRSKLPREGKLDPPAQIRHLPRHIQAAWDALAAAGIEVQDHKDQRYVPGMAVNIITFQPVQGIGCEVIHETIKPSIFYKDSLIQRADVIVARPWEASDGAPAEPQCAAVSDRDS